MKATLAFVTLLLVLAVGGLGYGYKLYDKQGQELKDVTAARDKQAQELKDVTAAREKQAQELKDVTAARDKQAEEFTKQTLELKGVCESRDALVKRVALLENEVRTLQDDATRNKLEPTIAAIKTGRKLIAARSAIIAATTSLARQTAIEDYGKLVESLKGHRVVFTGTIKDIGKRLISFSQLYLTLNVGKSYDVKFIFEKESADSLLSLNAGDEIILEGYVVSSGDLMHLLSVGGPSSLDQKTYDEAIRLGADK